MRLIPAAFLALCALAASPVAAQGAGFHRQGPPPAHSGRGPDRQPDRAYPRHDGIQLDVGGLWLEPAPPSPAEREPDPVRRPMFSDGWTRDGFGTQRGGWR